MNCGRGDLTSLTLAADGSDLLCDRDAQASSRRTSLEALGSNFRSDTYHRLLVGVQAGKAEVWVDGVRVASGIEVPTHDASVGLLTQGAAASFAGISVTPVAERLS